MSARDELAGVIVEAYGENPDMCPCEQDLDVADHILAAGYSKPRTITTAEELDALPPGSVVLSFSYLGQPSGQRISFQRWADGAWHRGARCGDTHPDNFLPATVLHDPEAMA